MIRRLFPLLLLLLALPVAAQQAPVEQAPRPEAAPAEKATTPANGESPSPEEETTPPKPVTPSMEAKIWFFSTNGKGEQGPVSRAELRELMKIKVVDGGTPLRRKGTRTWIYPGDAAELTDLIKWHFMLRGKKTGPVNTARLRKLVELGVLNGESGVWRAGMGEWREMRVVVELGGEEEAAATATGEAEPVDPRMGKFFVSLGVQAGGNIFSTTEGMGMVALGGRFSAVYVFNPILHLGIHATYTNLDGGGLDESFYEGVEGVHDFAFGATVQLGKQFSDRLWVGFGLDLGVSALRKPTLIRAKNVTTARLDIGPHLYTAPRAQLIYLFVHGRTRIGLQASLAVPVIMGQVDYAYAYDNKSRMGEAFATWSGLYFNLELLMGIR